MANIVNLNISGIPDGDHETFVRDDSGNVIINEDVTYSSEAAIIAAASSVLGANVDGYILNSLREMGAVIVSTVISDGVITNKYIPSFNDSSSAINLSNIFFLDGEFTINVKILVDSIDGMILGGDEADNFLYVANTGVVRLRMSGTTFETESIVLVPNAYYDITVIRDESDDINIIVNGETEFLGNSDSQFTVNMAGAYAGGLFFNGYIYDLSIETTEETVTFPFALSDTDGDVELSLGGGLGREQIDCTSYDYTASSSAISDNSLNLLSSEIGSSRVIVSLNTVIKTFSLSFTADITSGYFEVVSSNGDLIQDITANGNYTVIIPVGGLVLRTKEDGVVNDITLTNMSLKEIQEATYSDIPQANRKVLEYQPEPIDTPIVGYDVILLAGQSNMVGRYGPINPLLDITDPRILQYAYSDSEVKYAVNALDHFDEGADTVGMGLNIAKEYLKTLPANRGVILVPCADGDTGFGSGFWRSGGTGYETAIANANAALAYGGLDNNFVGTAWHQGEFDRTMTESEYADDLDLLISGFRAGITGASSSFFIVGQVPTWSTQYGAGVAAALADTPNRVLNTYYVTTSDLTSGGDSLHFDAESQRTLGIRYYDSLTA